MPSSLTSAASHNAVAHHAATPIASLSLFESEIPAGVYLPGGAEQRTLIEMPRRDRAARVLEPRWYQKLAWQEIDRGFFEQGHAAQLLVLPTGCGKTCVASVWIYQRLQKGETVLVLCDQDRLIEQMQNDLAEENVFPVIEKAAEQGLSKFPRHGRCVLASMQTLHRARLKKWPPDSFDWIVIDEAHEIRWAPIVKWFQSAAKQARVLGLTATPFRSDKKPLKQWFHHPFIKPLTLREAIEGYNGLSGAYEKPFLSRIKIVDVPAQHIDLSDIKIVGGDFDSRELDQKIWQHTNWLSSEILKHARAFERRHIWIYAPKIPTSDAIAAALRDMGLGVASYTSRTPNAPQIMERFEAGELTALTNVAMLIKGVNVPKVDCIALVCPTLTPGPLIQKIGRGTRLSPQTGKTDCLVIQFNFKVGNKHQLASAIEAILDGTDEPDARVSRTEAERRAQIRARTDRIIKSGRELDLLRAHDLARRQLADEDEAARRARLEARRAKYRQIETHAAARVYDPFAGLDKTLDARDVAPSAPRASGEQMARLEELSGGTIRARDRPRWSEAAADKRIADLEIRARFRYASEKQVKLMVETLRFDPKRAGRLKKWEASAAIEAERLRMIDALEIAGHDTDPATLPIWELAHAYWRTFEF